MVQEIVNFLTDNGLKKFQVGIEKIVNDEAVIIVTIWKTDKLVSKMFRKDADEKWIQLGLDFMLRELKGDIK